MELTPSELVIDGAVDLTYQTADRVTVRFPDLVLREDGVEVTLAPVAAQDGQRITVSAAFAHVLDILVSPEAPGTGRVFLKFGPTFLDPTTSRDQQPVYVDGGFNEYVEAVTVDWGDGEQTTPLPGGWIVDHEYGGSGDYLVRFVVVLRADRAGTPAPATALECRKTLHIQV